MAIRENCGKNAHLSKISTKFDLEYYKNSGKQQSKMCFPQNMFESIKLIADDSVINDNRFYNLWIFASS